MLANNYLYCSEFSSTVFVYYNDTYFNLYKPISCSDFFLNLICFSSAVQHGDQISLTCIHFFSLPFVLLQYKYLDIVLNATQQDLLVNSFQVGSNNPKLPIPPTPSLSPGGHKPILQVHGFLFCGDVHLCHKLDSRYK